MGEFYGLWNISQVVKKKKSQVKAGYSREQKKKKKRISAIISMAPLQHLGNPEGGFIN